MADMLNPYIVDLVGGLVLNKSMFEMQPGEALELTNFEPDIGGGYRRINGFAKFNSNEVLHDVVEPNNKNEDDK